MFQEGRGFGGGGGTGPGAANEDVYSAIRAIDPKTADYVWERRLSSPRTEGGVLTTASDLLFAGGRDGQFLALDARDGKILWLRHDHGERIAIRVWFKGVTDDLGGYGDRGFW